jgi:hypothetical protein
LIFARALIAMSNWGYRPPNAYYRELARREERELERQRQEQEALETDRREQERERSEEERAEYLARLSEQKRVDEFKLGKLHKELGKLQIVLPVLQILSDTVQERGHARPRETLLCVRRKLFDSQSADVSALWLKVESTVMKEAKEFEAAAARDPRLEWWVHVHSELLKVKEEAEDLELGIRIRERYVEEASKELAALEA